MHSVASACTVCRGKSDIPAIMLVLEVLPWPPPDEPMHGAHAAIYRCSKAAASHRGSGGLGTQTLVSGLGTQTLVLLTAWSWGFVLI